MITKIPSNVACKQREFDTENTISVEYCEDKRFVTEQVKDEISNRLVTKSKFQTIDPVASMAKYRVSDFALENLIAIGADLKPAKLSSNDMNVISNLKTQFEKIDSSTSKTE